MVKRKSVTVDANIDSATKMLRRMQLQASPAGIALYLTTVVHPRLARRARERFNSEGDGAVGGTWVPLKQSTLEIKAALGYGSKKINVRTGHLRDSIVNSSPVLGHNVYGETLDFPGNWDRPDLFNRHMQASGSFRDAVARPVVGIEYENDVAHMLTTLQTWVVSGRRVKE